SSRRRHTRSTRDWSSDVCSSDLGVAVVRLSDLVSAVPEAERLGTGDPEITGITHDSRRVKAGDLFVCIPGLKMDGHAFLKTAVRSEERRVGKESRCGGAREPERA